MSDIEIRFGHRQTGRSTLLIEWLIEGEPDQKRVIVCHSENEAKRLHAIANELCPTVESWQLYSAGKPPYPLHGRKITEAAIDNLEFYLDRIVGHRAPVTKVTATLAQDFEDYHQRGFNVRAIL